MEKRHQDQCQKTALSRSSFTVGMVDFDFDLKIDTKQFLVIVAGRSFEVNGTKLNARAIKAINRRKRVEP